MAHKAEQEDLKTRLSLAEGELARLRSESGLFKMLVKSVKEYAIFMLDPQGRVLTWNEGAERLKQYRESEILGRNFRMLYTDADQKAGRPEKNLEDAREHGQTEDHGWRQKKDGTTFWADALITAIYDPEGELLGFSKVIRDLTEANKAEKHARDLEIIKLADKLKNDFLSLLSHEMRTPLTTIKGLTSLVEEEAAGPISNEQQGYLKQVLKATDILTTHVNNLLDLNQLQAGRFQLRLQAVNFPEIVDGVVYAMQPQAAAKNLWLQNHVTPEIPEIVADDHRIGQVLVHLLDNAIKFTPERGRIEIRARVEGSSLLCEIQDTGQGVAAEDFEKLFTSFSQADMSSTRQEGGLGIGLRLSRLLIEAHGGTIGLRSEGPGKGVIVWFTLPLTPRSTSADNTPDEVSPGS